MSISKKRIILSAVFSCSILLSGCGMLEGLGVDKEENLDIDQEVTYLKETEEGKTEQNEESEKATVAQELYLFNKDGLVVPKSFQLPATNEPAQQVIEYLIEGGPITNILPNGFRAVLPQDTTVQGIAIKDGTATVDFSNEFVNYNSKDEQKIAQSITWTLTQFDTIENVKIWLNGKEITEMPESGFKVADKGMSRDQGINLHVDSPLDITATSPMTLYYLAENEGEIMYVPVTKRVQIDDNKLQTAINELINGPEPGDGLTSYFQPKLQLLDEPKVEDGVVTLNFNEFLYHSADGEKKIVSEHVLNALVLTLTEQEGINSVSVQVNGKDDLLTEGGEKLSEPVTRPEKVNTGSF
ncbi:GerMN domain-containing protein [Bacillus carboniphilus]|uniref:GerMN domain-containing protein n=1 Tax=Bacillus carboniphilus TaxID=86663 RepID=A0ABY9K2V0_9BACI|nr:GerMN domain-containing protein [Bacillus carboniphilus]WLR44120.1 GerMN domain-containing protein [Bacillus carboniphilus]